MVDKKEIEKLAQLARIKIPDEEISSLTGEIDSILEYVRQIQEAGPDSLETENTSNTVNIMREDGIPHDSGIYSKDILAQSPQTEGEYIKVKKILPN